MKTLTMVLNANVSYLGVEQVSDEEKEWMKFNLERYMVDLTWQLRDRRKTKEETYEQIERRALAERKLREGET